MPLPRLRAPGEHGGVLAVPPLAEAGPLLERNRKQLAAPIDILNRSLPDLRNRAGQEVREEAGRFLRHLGITIPDLSADGLVLAGHQPELYHPGVWVKNFAIQGLSRRFGLTPLSLIVDNDNAKGTAIKVPSSLSGRTTLISFDQWAGPVPHEELSVRDEAMFARFPDTVEAETKTWPFRPVLSEFWRGAVAASTRTGNLGERLAAARRRLEERWNCRNLELPLSRLCQTESFAWFACHLLAHLPRFHAIHNDALKAFRKRHGIRSRHHPVPELGCDGDWLEAPFWAWRKGEIRRHRVFARKAGEVLELRCGEQVVGRLPLTRPVNDAWKELDAGGIKLRTRALTTTLFARVFVADLFVHGIGGGIYDELTDEIIRGFYNLEPPAFLVVSATLHLPFAGSAGVNPQALERELRDLHYNPDRHLNAAADPRLFALCEEKQAWIRRVPENADARRRRFESLHEINERLRPYAASLRDDLLSRLARSREALEAARVLEDREYAFCLFPEAALRPVCDWFLHAT